MRFVSFSKLPDGIAIVTSEGRILVEVLDPAILHIVYTLAEEFGCRPSLAVLPKEPRAGTLASWRVMEGPPDITIATEALQLRIDKSTCAFTYMDAEGRVVAREPERGGKTLVPTEAMRTVFDDSSSVANEQSVDGLRARVTDVREVVDRTAYHTKLEFVWGADEALYGLGSHEEGILNLRGHHRYLYQQNMKAVMPVLVSTKGYGILMDSYSMMTFHDDVYGSYIWTDVDDELDFYFILGGDLDGVVAGYRKLTGKAPLLPKWAYGYVQSKERYKSQDELLEVVRGYRQRQIPLDCIVLDWVSWPGDLWGQKSFDPTRFPNPAKMMDDLHDMNARLMISVWPIMLNNGENQKEMREAGHLLGNQANYDAFSAAARALYWKQANEGLFSHGIDAWWCDCTEPFEADWKGAVKPEPEERLLINTREGKRYLDPEYLSAYSLQHSKGIYEGQRAVTDKKRVVNLTRSSYSGQQRYSTITWSGDTAANWDTLRRQIPEGLNFCASGAPYWTMDIGAFFVSKREQWFWNGDYDLGCEDPGYRELHTRWLQVGAFLPMFRSHGTDTPREVWRFGEPGTPFYDAILRFINLRYRLMPYIYSLAGMVTHDDYTMMRLLGFDFPSDKRTWDVGDEFMFGPAFLVSPVTSPMYYGPGGVAIEGAEKSRPVYLPEGCDWYDFWTGAQLAGGQVVSAPATIATMPLYVRAGSIVPMGPLVQHTGEAPGGPIEVRVYPGADGEFSLYDDEGDGYGYEGGASAKVRFTWDDATGKLTIHEREGAFPGMRKVRAVWVVLVSPGVGVGVGAGVELATGSAGWAAGAVYDGAELVLDVR